MAVDIGGVVQNTIEITAQGIGQNVPATNSLAFVPPKQQDASAFCCPPPGPGLRPHVVPAVVVADPCANVCPTPVAPGADVTLAGQDCAGAALNATGPMGTITQVVQAPGQVLTVRMCPDTKDAEFVIACNADGDRIAVQYDAATVPPTELSRFNLMTGAAEPAGPLSNCSVEELEIKSLQGCLNGALLQGFAIIRDNVEAVANGTMIVGEVWRDPATGTWGPMPAGGTVGECASGIPGDADVYQTCADVPSVSVKVGLNLLDNGNMEGSTGAGATSSNGPVWTTAYARAANIYAAGPATYAFFTTNAGQVTGGNGVATGVRALGARSMAVNVGPNTNQAIMQWANIYLENGKTYRFGASVAILNNPYGVALRVDNVVVTPLNAPAVLGAWQHTDTEFTFTGATGYHTIGIHSNTAQPLGNDHAFDEITLVEVDPAQTANPTVTPYSDTVRAVVEQIVQTSGCSDDRRDNLLDGILQTLVDTSVAVTPAADVEWLELCDDTTNDGQNVVSFVRRLTTNSAGATVSADFAQDGVTPYTVVGTAGPCAIGAPATDVEWVALCDDTTNDGQNIVPFLRRLVTDSAGITIATDYEQDGVTAYAVVGAVGPCAKAAPDVELLTLCDDNGSFVRRITTDSAGTPTVADFELDGVTPYVTAGDVVLCNVCRETYDEVANGAQVTNGVVALPANVGSFTVSAQTGTFDVSFDSGATWPLTGRVGSRTWGEGNRKMVAASNRIRVRSPNALSDVDVIWEILQSQLCGVETVTGRLLSSGQFALPAGVISVTVTAQAGSFDVSFDGGATWPLTNRIGKRTWGNGDQFVISNSALMVIRSNLAADDIDITWEF